VKCPCQFEEAYAGDSESLAVKPGFLNYCSRVFGESILFESQLNNDVRICEDQ
jgi:hypothetical protein